ncbi:MAG: type II secretion system F family protein [Candidatus Nanoarchaeia archaeon]|nr:type II secretion system F family protein [Candidatus Nanoarchaeia archaeon]
MPELRSKLSQSGMRYSPQEFIKRTFLSAFYMTTGIGVLILVIMTELEIFSKMMYLIFPLLYVFMFYYMMKVPDVKVIMKGKSISKEIVFAGRFLVIELESGVSLYDAMINVSKNYEVIGGYFKEIIDRVSMGTSMEDAINETIELTPSSNLTKVLWQILNSLRTGADISKSLTNILDQIAREQIIEVKEYGRKLNPLAMFFMVIAVILPSLGITMFIVLTTFISVNIDLTALMAIAFGLGFIQFMFFSMIKSSRPSVEL